MSPNDGIEKYRELVDELVARRKGVLPRWVLETGWPALPENEKINAFLSKLTPDEKGIVAFIAREGRDDGIHDTLVVLQEYMDLKNLRLVMDGVELPVSPFGTEIFCDWVARVDGASWPPPSDPKGGGPADPSGSI